MLWDPHGAVAYEVHRTEPDGDDAVAVIIDLNGALDWWDSYHRSADVWVLRHCPEVCPAGGADLRRDGYPLAHQGGDGTTCGFRWAS